jgi:predicted dehydrogenase
LPRWHIDGTDGSAESPFSLNFDTKAWAQFEFVGPDGSKSRLPIRDAGLTETQIWEQFGQAIANGKPLAVPAESVLPTMALLDAARESSKKGAAVEIDSALFRGPS